MASAPPNFVIEAFLTDLAFINRTRNINNLFAIGTGQVGQLNQKALSYFNVPANFQDGRAPNTRSVNWVATTSPQLIIDNNVFATFITNFNNAGTFGPQGFFELLDYLLFKYNPNDTNSTRENFLLADSDITSLYVPGTFTLSSTIVTDTLYLSGNTTQSVGVPSYVSFDINIPTGQTSTRYSLKIYTAIDAFLQSYNQSTIVSVIPPLPYDKLYGASLIGAIDNIFSTATLTTNLAYATQQAVVGQIAVSGIITYQVALTDGTNSLKIPFNLLYKGRAPTAFQIRTAIKNALLNSGVGTEAGWRARAPGLFVDGRFYIIPLWNQTYQKPDQIIFPNILPVTTYINLSNEILASLGYGDVTNAIDALQVYYNHMLVTAVPDLSGNVNAVKLSTLIPDYQSFSTQDEQFVYMANFTQNFARELNMILTIDSGALTNNFYTPITEGLLSFYSFTVGAYEFCVITKDSYNLILESSL